MSSLSKLVLLSILIAVIVVSLGAYTRLTHAGLGCPDWPGCYGFVDVPETSEQIKKAEAAFPERPVEPEKAWNEMIHRYFAGALSILILAIAVISVKNSIKKTALESSSLEKEGLGKPTPVKLPLIILAVVIFQAALGMWTVTMKLMPVVVMGHLLGGFTTLCLLFLLFLRLQKFEVVSEDSPLVKFKKPAFIGIIILALQITLGGWTSSNYAALVCTELPICQSGWMQQLTFEDSFDLIPPEKETYEFGHLDHDERLTIHVMHRFGAILTTLYLAWLGLSILFKAKGLYVRRAASLTLGLLVFQVSLGVSNVWFSLPLSVAVAHNVIAVCLMLGLIAVTYYLSRKKGGEHGRI